MLAIQSQISTMQCIHAALQFLYAPAHARSVLAHGFQLHAHSKYLGNKTQGQPPLMLRVPLPGLLGFVAKSDTCVKQNVVPSMPM